MSSSDARSNSSPHGPHEQIRSESTGPVEPYRLARPFKAEANLLAVALIISFEDVVFARFVFEGFLSALATDFFFITRASTSGNNQLLSIGPELVTA